MTKYEIKTDTFEFQFGKTKETIPDANAEQIFDWYISGSCNDPETVESYDTLSAAQDAFHKGYSDYGRTYAEKTLCFWILRGKVAWIEENTYDEDGEFDCGGEVYDISAEDYKRPVKAIFFHYRDKRREVFDTLAHDYNTDTYTEDELEDFCDTWNAEEDEDTDADRKFVYYVDEK